MLLRDDLDLDIGAFTLLLCGTLWPGDKRNDIEVTSTITKVT